MPLNSARTSTTSEAAGLASGPARLSPRPGATIQNARAASADIRPFCGFERRDTILLVFPAVTVAYFVKAGAVLAAVAVLVRRHRARHPFASFGAANAVTLARAA